MVAFLAAFQRLSVLDCYCLHEVIFKTLNSHLTFENSAAPRVCRARVAALICQPAADRRSLGPVASCESDCWV